MVGGRLSVGGVRGSDRGGRKGKCSFYDDRKEDRDYRVQRVSRRSWLFAPQALSRDMNIV